MPSLIERLTTPPDVSQMAQRRPQMRSRNPGMRERIGSALYDLASGAGLSAQADRMRREGAILADFLPVVGDAIAADDAGRAYGAGDYLGAGLAALGVMPIVGDVVGKAAKKGIRAYHGSPHDFDKFSMDKIGTGEGAQAYGHGLYFAEAEPVARGYRDQLSARAAPNDARGNAFDLVQRMGGDVEATVEIVRDGIENAASPNTQQFLQETLKHLEDGTFADFERPLGRMYEVNIKTNPDDFLDWDKPLSEQPEIARIMGYEDPSKIAAERAANYAKFSPPKGDTFEDLFAPLSEKEMAAAEALSSMPQSWGRMTGKDAYEAMKNKMGALDWPVGADANARRSYYSGAATRASERLREQGIPGIKYLDANSRGAGEGSRNYVVFDDSLIEIVRKYGIAGALAAGLITREQGQQMQDQGVI